MDFGTSLSAHGMGAPGDDHFYSKTNGISIGAHVAFRERRRKVRSYPLGAVHLYLSDGVQTNLCHPGRAAYTTGVEAWI